MDSHSNGHTGDGRTHDEDALPQSGFIEKNGITVMESGAAACEVDSQHGGRIVSWMWRTTPPKEAVRSRHHAGEALQLVNPAPGALIDHFLPLGTKPEEFASDTHRELGDFTDEPFRSQTANTGGEIRMGLLRDGAIRAGKRVAEVRMAKSPALRPGAPDVAVLYRVINSSVRPLQILFAVEFNVFAPGVDNQTTEAWREAYYLIDGRKPEDPSLGSSGVAPNATHVALVNPPGEMALQLGWDRECDLWRMPPASGGPGVRLLSVWRIQLPPRDNWAMGLWLAPG